MPFVGTLHDGVCWYVLVHHHIQGGIPVYRGTVCGWAHLYMVGMYIVKTYCMLYLDEKGVASKLYN